jgi:methionyl-tRNA formyltransferase
MAKHGEREGGVFAVVTDSGIDSGPVLAQTAIALTGTETADTIRAIHFDASVELLRRTLPMLRSRRLRGTPQDRGRRTYFGSPTNEDCTAHWSDGCESVLRTVRAAHPRPGARVHAGDGRELRILSARRVDAQRGLPRPEDTLVWAADGRLAVRLRPIEAAEPARRPVDDDDARRPVLSGAPR